MVLKVAALVDLPREKGAGGHVKYWERLAQACVKSQVSVDLTVYFSGNGPEIALSPNVRFRALPPVFSTVNLKFLPYIPAHTDLAPYHRKLALELPDYDVIHATDAYFAFAKTAERVAQKRNVPLVTSLHTDTPAYAELFTRHTLKKLLGQTTGNAVDALFKLSARQRKSKQARLRTHLKACRAVFAMRPEDVAFAQEAGGAGKIKPMRLGVDKTLFKPDPAARDAIEAEYGLPPQRFLALFVGRVDSGKNADLLLAACSQALRENVALHLIVVGAGPLTGPIQEALGPNATLTGLVPPEKLARLYAAADCLCITSDIEIGGLVGVEAMASGCPVLVSKKSSIASLYGNPQAMKEVESPPAAWAAALAFLARHSAQREAMRDAARAFRDTKIASWEEILEQDFFPVWQQAAKEKR
ncbi:MAG: glycosyltransferase [Alphaproteobacteria bacterium]|nr:glycosyltransferase [Alphaproteobacteria bacterium]